MTGMTLMRLTSEVDPLYDHQYRNEPGYLDSMRSTAGRALADRITRDASLYRRVDPSKEAEFDPRARVQHIWEIGVETNKSEIEARKADMDKARAEGRAEAAEIVRAAADRFEQVDGFCKFVIMSALRSAAREIEKPST